MRAMARGLRYERLVTERANRASAHLDRLDALGIAALMNREDARVLRARAPKPPRAPARRQSGRVRAPATSWSASRPVASRRSFAARSRPRGVSARKRSW